MTIHPGHLREYVIRPTLRDLGLYSEAAEELLMLTAADELECGSDKRGRECDSKTH